MLFTWCWLHTGPGLWPVLLLHTSINVSSYLLPRLLPGIGESSAYSLGTLAVFALAAIALVAFDGRLRQRAEVSAKG